MEQQLNTAKMEAEQRRLSSILGMSGGGESRRLLTDVIFEVRLQPAGGDAVVLTDADEDGIIYEKGIKSGDYTVEVTAIDGYQFVGVPDSVNVREKIVYQQIDVAQEIKKESEINVAAEDTGVSMGAVDAPQVTMPAQTFLGSK